MKMKAAGVYYLFVFFIFFTFAAHSQNSCNSTLEFQPLFSVDGASLRCLSVWESEGFALRYQQQLTGVWGFILSAPNTDGYIAIGFSPDGKMVGSNAVVGWVSSGGAASVKKYYLGGTSPSSVTVQSSFPGIVISNASMAALSNRVYMAFQLTGQPTANLIYAVGPSGFFPVGPDYFLVEHRNDRSTFMNFTSGQQQAQRPGDVLLKAHGLTAMLGWGILLPIGVMAARYLRSWDPLWFNSHVAIQVTGFSLGVAGVATGFVLEHRTGASVNGHKAIGIVVLTFGCLQASAILIRPDKASKLRKYWNWYHYAAGRSVIALAATNVFYGIHLAAAGLAWNIGFAVALGVMFGVSASLELRMWLRR